MTLREEIATLRDMIKRSGGMPLDVLRCNAPGKVMVVMRNKRPARRLISVAAIRRAEVDGVVHVSRVRKTITYSQPHHYRGEIKTLSSMHMRWEWVPPARPSRDDREASA